MCPSWHLTQTFFSAVLSKLVLAIFDITITNLFEALLAQGHMDDTERANHEAST